LKVRGGMNAGHRRQMTVQIRALDCYFDWRRFLGRLGVARKSIFTDMLTSME
jgi:hypothetical protein